jgi:urease accessory protein
MLIADRYVGHRSDRAVADRLADADPSRVVLSDTERRRSRVRTETTDGRDLGLVVARDLRDGDVLEAEDGTLLVVDLEPVDALVIDFAAADLDPARALAFGHALGNRHWDLALRGSEALFPVTETPERMEATVEELLPAGVTYHYDAVSPQTFDGASTADHTHDPGHAHGDVGHEHGGDGHGHHSHDGRSIDARSSVRHDDHAADEDGSE